VKKPNALQTAQLAKTIVHDLPALGREGQLTYCLMRDPRVPAPQKAAFAATFAAVVRPRPLPVMIEKLPLTVAEAGLAISAFNASVSPEVVRENRAALAKGTSYFHTDIEAGRRALRTAAKRLPGPNRENRGRQLGGWEEAA
jgi:hypothetical protein